MKEAIGGVSIFQLVIVFLLLFTGVMCLTINHSKAYGVKDEIINTIELMETGVNTEQLGINTVNEITNELTEGGYRLTGTCPNSEWIGYDRNGTEVTDDSASFCVRAVNVSDAFYEDSENKCKGESLCTPTAGDFPKMIYYEVILFYQLDVPVIGDALKFEIKGATKVLFG